MEINKISFCIVAMNRLHHVKQTLPQNIEDNKDFKGVEFILLDYNSNDGLEEWVKSNMSEYIKSGMLRFFRTTAPEYFDRTHSRNMAFKLASGDLLCNLDADNYTGKGFASYIDNEFRNDQSMFLVADTKRRFYFLRNAFGRYVVRREHFMEIRGLNEAMKSYGSDTMELYGRLEKRGVREVVIKNTKFLQAISHDDEERISNEFFLKKLDKCFIHYKSISESELLIFYNDGEFEHSIIISKSKEPFLPASLKDNILKKGSWVVKGKTITTIDAESVEMIYSSSVGVNGIVQENSLKEFYQITDEQFLIEIAKIYSFITNVEIIQEYDTYTKEELIVNSKDFGVGQVKENFSDTILIVQ